MSGELMWGTLQLDREAPNSTYELEALAGDGEDLDFGDPAAIEVALRSLLQDGSVVFSQGHDNREVTIAVAVRALTGDGLAQAESALMRQIGRPGVNLVWHGSSPFSAPAVFEVVTSTLSYRYNANREHALSRRYVIRLVCLPWARSSELVVSSAPPVPRDNAGAPTAPTTVTIDTASSTTRWTSTSGTRVLVEGNTAVQAPGSVGADLIYTAASPVPVDTTRFLLVDYKTTGSTGAVFVEADGARLTIESLAASPTFAGYQRLTLRAPSVPFTKLRVVVPINPQRPGGTLTVTNLARVSYPPSVGTDHQTFRRLPIQGSVRTQGTIRVEHETGALGVVMAYTWADDGSGYLPPLSPYRPGTPLAYPNTISGSVDNLDTPAVFSVPADAVPAGDYLILARLRFPAAASVSVVTTAATLIGGTVLDRTQATSTIATSVTGATTGHYVTLGAVTLPTVRLADTKAATVRVTVAVTDPATMEAELDEVWLFNTSIGSLTYVLGQSGTPVPGGPSRRLWIQPETVTEKPTILRGHAADGSDAFYASAGAGARIEAVGTHELRPPLMSVFTVTSGVQLAATSVEYHPRWHTHPVV